MTNTKRAKRNLRKGLVPAYERDIEFTDRLMATYGNKRKAVVSAVVAGVQELRRSNAATSIPSKKVRRQTTRKGRTDAAIHRSGEGN